MKIESSVLKGYCLTVDFVLRDVGLSFDVDFIFYNTIFEGLYAVNAGSPPNFLDILT